MGVICHWCRQRIGKQIALMDQDVPVLAQAKTSISINKNATPVLHAEPPYNPFQPPLIAAKLAV